MAVSAQRIALRGGRHAGVPLGEPASAEPAATPCRAAGLELLGSFEASGHKRSPCLVRRADGQMVQLSPLLYEVLSVVDGRRDHADIAQAVSSRVGRRLGPQDVAFLVGKKIRPLGLLRDDDGCEPIVKKMNPLLALRLRLVVSNPSVTGRIAALFAPLFHAPFVIAFSLAFLGLSAWMLFVHGLGPPTRQALYEPQLLLVVFGLTVLSAGFHELGHAAACRYSGGRPGAMGVGLYLVWPAFYTDVTDAYRLDRRGRLRTDLGGIYFNAIFAVITFGLWRLTGQTALLIVIPLQGLQMLRQLIPMVRLDGYHILADLTGVPDLFAHIKPILTSLLPTRWGRGDAASLKPWVRAVVTAWVVIVVPLLLFFLGMLAYALPRVLATAWDSAGQTWTSAQAQFADGHFAAASLDLLGICALMIPALSGAYLVTRIVRRTGRRVWRATEGHPVRRIGALLLAGVLVAALLAAWWPRGQYTPIQENEAGTLMSLGDMPTGQVARVEGIELSSLALPPVEETTESVTAPAGHLLVDPASTEELAALVLASTADERVRFGFPLPPLPGEGDNQALVINTVDGSSMIDLALSLVFVDASTVDNRNEAFAFAACVSCETVAIAFQVVIIVEGNHVVIPENLAAAINVECVRCVTQAIATQLITELPEPLREAELAELELLWSQLEDLDAKAGEMALEDLLVALDAIQQDIEILLGLDDLDSQTALDSAETDGSFSADGSVGDDPGVVTATASPTAEPEQTPTAEPSTSPSSEPTTSPSPSASPSTSP